MGWEGSASIIGVVEAIALTGSPVIPSRRRGEGKRG